MSAKPSAFLFGRMIRLSATLLLTSAGTLLFAQEPTGDDPAKKLEEIVRFIKDDKRYAEAAAACEAIAADAKAPGRTRQRAFDLLIDLHVRNNNRPKAIETAEALRQAFPENDEVDRNAVFKLADLYMQWKEAASNAAPAVAALKAYTERHPNDRETCSRAYLTAARLYARADQYDEAQASAEEALKRIGEDNLWLSLEILGFQQDLASKAKRSEDRLRILKAFFDEKFLGILGDDSLATRRIQYGETLRDLGRMDERCRFFETNEREDSSPTLRQRWCRDLADTLCDMGKTNEAFTVYERVITGHPEVNTYWNEAQTRIVDILIAQGKTDEALRAAHILYDAAPNSGFANAAVSRMLTLFRTNDPKDPRADALDAMNRYGACGRDGKPGTADDPKPVLPGIGYPNTTTRKQAFASALPTLGDGVDASLQRGWCALYVGDPKQAVAHFTDAFRRSRASRASDIGRILLQNGFRPLQGPEVDLDEVSNFLAYGQEGADGKKGTEDDLPDPFSALGIPAASAKPGGLSPLPTDEVKALQALITEIRTLIRTSASPRKKAAAVSAYERVVEALVTVDRKETLGWLRETLRSETDGPLLGALARFGASVSNADQLNLAAANRFYAELTQTYEQAQQPVPKEISDAQRWFDSSLAGLKRKPSAKKKR